MHSRITEYNERNFFTDIEGPTDHLVYYVFYTDEITKVISIDIKPSIKTINKILLDIFSKILGKKDFSSSEFNIPLRDMGLDSLRSIQARNLLNTAFEQKFHATVFLDYPTIDLIFKFLVQTLAPDNEIEIPQNLDDLSEEELVKIVNAQIDSWNLRKP